MDDLSGLLLAQGQANLAHVSDMDPGLESAAYRSKRGKGPRGNDTLERTKDALSQIAEAII